MTECAKFVHKLTACYSNHFTADMGTGLFGCQWTYSALQPPIHRLCPRLLHRSCAVAFSHTHHAILLPPLRFALCIQRMTCAIASPFAFRFFLSLYLFLSITWSAPTSTSKRTHTTNCAFPARHATQMERG